MICCDWQSTSDVVRPDGLTGTLMALEGIRDAAVILHGPTGCRGHHSAMSERAFPRGFTQERLNYAEHFYFGQPRIPTTYLDGDDYVFGAKDKLLRAVRTVLTKDPALLAVVNSPGAALIGEDLRQGLADAAMGIPGVTIEMPASSQPMAEGYQQAVLAVLETLGLSRLPVFPKTISLIGMSIAHHHWAGSLAELRRLLALCGIEVLCAPGAGSPIAEWYSIPRAACHMVVHAEYADRIANWLAEHSEGPVVFPESGAPVGFAFAEQWVIQAANAVGADPSAAASAIRERRRQVSWHMSRITGVTGAPKGMTCSIQADPSIALPLARFLYDYLGVLPVSVETPDYVGTPLARELAAFLDVIGCGDAWQVPWQTVDADYLFADGHQVGRRLASGHPEGGIELSLPLGGYVDFVPKSFLGAEGAAYLVEKIVNAIAGCL